MNTLQHNATGRDPSLGSDWAPLILSGDGAILIVPLGPRRGSGRVVQTPAQLDAAVSAWPAIAERLLRAWARVRRAA